LNKIVVWLREANTSDNVDSLIARCTVAAAEIEKQESLAFDYRKKMVKAIDAQIKWEKLFKSTWCYRVKEFFLGKEENGTRNVPSL
jgi:hypothetical protein